MLILQRENESIVEVSGLGSIAYINADTGSHRCTNSDDKRCISRREWNRYNAGAGTSLTTSSYANQSNSQTHRLIQAFGGAQEHWQSHNGRFGNSSDGYTIDGTRTIPTTFK